MITYELDGGGSDPATLNLPMPTRWSREDIELPVENSQAFVHLGFLQMTVNNNSKKYNIYVVRYRLANAVVDGVARSKDDAGFFVVFYIVEVAASKANVWTLSQTDSPVFSDRSERGDYLPAGKVGKKAVSLTGVLPVWKKSEAIWPTVNGMPMDFVGSTDLLDTEIHRACATTNERIFWFSATDDGNVRFKAVTQQIKFQSAEDHYASEALVPRVKSKN